MPIRVRARLTRPGSTYLAGETVHADIELTNSGEQPAPIAWCCCQVHCQAVVAPSYVKANAMPNAGDSGGGATTGNGATAFLSSKGDAGAVAYSSRPSVICCNLLLAPGETKQLRHSDTINEDGSPPSFRGKAMSYYYKLTVGVQAPNAPVQMLRVPFRLLRILTTSGLGGVLNAGDEHRAPPANPFLCDEEEGDADGGGERWAGGPDAACAVLQSAGALIDNVTCVRNRRAYDVAMERGRVAKLTLARSSYKLGDEVVGHFDFADAHVPCVQYLVVLEQVEEVTEEYRKRADQPVARTSVWDYTETCLYAASSQFRLPIPLSASPSFFTDTLHVKWRLQFEFVLAADDDQIKAMWPVDHPDGDEKTWVAPKSLKVETMVWHLPIKVFPCNPLNACLAADQVDKWCDIEF